MHLQNPWDPEKAAPGCQLVPALFLRSKAPSPLLLLTQHLPGNKDLASPVQANIVSSVGLAPNFLEARWGFLDTFA